MDINLLKNHLQTVHGKINSNLSFDYGNSIQPNLQEPNLQEGSKKFVNETLDIVSSFLENSLGDELNEDTVLPENILEAIYNLNYTCSHVNGLFNGYEVDNDNVTEYFDSYFGHELNESVSEEDIIEAIERLNLVCQEVNEYFEIDEGVMSSIGKGLVIGGGLALAGKGAYHAAKGWLKRRKQRKADAKDAAKHRSNVEYMKDKKPGDTIRTKRPGTRPTPTAGGVEKKPTVLPTAPKDPRAKHKAAEAEGGKSILKNPGTRIVGNPNKNLPKPLIKK